ncbi:MAG: hypothetical protein AAF561_09935 [Planctomycetota bacterium]
MPDPLPYDPDAAEREERRKMMRLVWAIIVAKVLLVIANTFGAFSDAPAILKLAGVGMQISLTVVFLLLLLKLTARR